MPAAGNDVRMPSDIFRFHKVYPYVGCNPCIPATCPDSGAVVQGEVCPCTHRCPVKLKPRPYDLNYMYPKCVDRPLSPYFETPLYHEETPFIIWPSNNPDLTPKRSRPCRVPFSKHLSIVCPNWAPRVGPDLTMFLRTRDPYC
uniref:Uncharacterized protein n=1 Tax=Biomphalaria glabrata TaxID=6526 RepID=A0A2C9KTE4_BIOGL